MTKFPDHQYQVYSHCNSQATDTDAQFFFLEEHQYVLRTCYKKDASDLDGIKIQAFKNFNLDSSARFAYFNHIYGISPNS